MTRRILTNKPLVEAIFELRWELRELTAGIKIDPHYKILIGSLYDKVKGEYPFHERLPTATMPDEIAGYVVQHRFRKAENQWPLVQVGPGIITLNDTVGYVWEDFEQRISQVVSALLERYPDLQNLRFSSLLLRYIDSVEFDYSQENVFHFLKARMKMNIDVYEELFKETGVSELPLNIDLRFSYSCTQPIGIVNLRFARGQRDGAAALLWETIVQTTEEKVPQDSQALAGWISSAHQLTDDWFFKIIEGDLEKRFE